MRKSLLLHHPSVRLFGLVFALMIPGASRAVTPTGKELHRAQAWTSANFPAAGARQHLPPFSFVYDGKPSRELLPAWKFAARPGTQEGSKRRQIYNYRDPATGLELTCDVTSYDDFPAVEWILWFKNTGAKATPILEDVQTLDARFESPGEPFMLHRALGSDARPTDFSPVDEPLAPGTQIDLAPVGGRSSDTASLPFFNLAAPAGTACGDGESNASQKLCDGGAMIGLGWSGEWQAGFHATPEGVELKMGMQRTHLRLEPGERIRTPRMLLIFWQGAEPLRANNLLRSFLLACHTPRPGGRLPVMPVAHNTWFQFHLGNAVTEKNQIDFAELIHEKKIAIDTLVIDAGWFEGGWPNGVGNWFPRKDAFPRGLGPVGEAVHEMGMRFSVWFEPERVSEGTWLYTHHPEWLLEAGQQPEWLKGNHQQALLNLGNPDARRWLTDTISNAIDEDHIDIFRHDFNIDPLPFWRSADAPDRQGMAEIRYVEGLYAFWDELLKRHPNLMIDNCASGGRRIDLETSSRSIPLWRSDLFGDTLGEQALGLGLNLYVPLSSGGLFIHSKDPPNLYQARSTMSSGIILLWDVRLPDLDVALARKIANEAHAVSKYYYGDVYPLTPITTRETDWLSYQCDRPDLGEGMVMAFRRKMAMENSITVKLRGLITGMTYEVEDLDSHRTRTATGQELATGLRLDLAAPGSSALLVYREKK